MVKEFDRITDYFNPLQGRVLFQVFLLLHDDQVSTENVMKTKKPLDYLLFAARTFLLLTFVVLLATATICYSILPNQIVVGAIANCRKTARPKEIYFAMMLVVACVYLFFVWLTSYSPFPKRPLLGNEKLVKYWYRDAHIELYSKITQFWVSIMGGACSLCITLHIIQIVSLSLSAPLTEAANSRNHGLLIMLISLICLALFHATLVVVKWCDFSPHVRRPEKTETDNCGEGGMSSN